MGTMKEKLLLEEFKQAWEHYRHIENARLRLIGFLYTVALASAGAVMVLFKEDKPSRDAYSITLVIAFLVGSLALSIHLHFKSQKAILHHYVTAWRHIRKIIYDQDFTQLNNALDVFENSPVKRLFHSETFMTNIMIWLVGGVAALYLAVGVFHGWSNLEPTVSQQAGALVGLSVLVAGFSTFVKVRGERLEAQKGEKNESPNSPQTSDEQDSGDC